MRCAVTMILSLVVFSAVIFADNITWTGSESGEWNNPGNWSGGKVPGENDNVTISDNAPNHCRLPGGFVHVNSLTNNGILLSEDDSNLQVKGDLVNNGSMDCKNLAISCKDMLNNGSIEASSLDLSAENMGNANGATIISTSEQGIMISANELANEGTIESKGANENTTFNSMSGIMIAATYVYNWGKIQAADGETGYHGGDISIQVVQYMKNYSSGKILAGDGGDMNILGKTGDGGSIYITKLNKFINEGQMYSGNGGIGGFGHSGDGGDILIQNESEIDNMYGLMVSGSGVHGGDIFLNSFGTLISGITAAGSYCGYWDESGEPGLGKIAAETYQNGSVFLVGDSVIVNDDIQSFGKVEAIANHFVCEVNACWEVFFGDDMKIYTTPEGDADFSGTHAQNALGVTALEQNDPLIGEIYIYTNNLIPPAEGMDYICKPDPHINPADPDFVRASAIGLDQIGDIGETGSLPILFQNQSTASRTLDYAVSSMNGWVMPASGSTTALDPFEFDSADVAFTVPSDATSEDADSVMIVVSIEENYSDTSWVMIGCSGEAAGSVSVPRDNRSRPSDYMLSVYPNPFNSVCRIFTSHESRIEIFDVTGRRVARFDASDVFTNGFLWQPDGILGSGEYLIQATTRDGRIMAQQVIYLK
ncbi:T9SS type A sorting domain-containing protein [bacterium]|nr:T9SS type A sorting domain-containing protein [bacterium]